MARPNKEQSEKIDEMRDKTLKWFYGIQSKALRHLEKSLDAVVPCGYCNADGTSPKQDASGMCIKCHGMKVVEDVEQRNWATKEIIVRTSPPVKSVEQKVDMADSFDELKKEYGAKSDKELQEIARRLVSNGE